MSEKLYHWFAKERGIKADTLKAFGVKLDGQDVIFPYDTGEKTRRIYDDGRREFFFTKNARPCLFHPNIVRGGKVAFIVEGETDAMKLWQELKEAGKEENIAIFGLPGVNTWQAEFSKQLGIYDKVYVILDNDPDYKVAAIVDNTWKEIRASVGTKAKRIKLPSEINDLCDFFRNYDLGILDTLAKRHSGSRWKPLDFTRPAEPPDWLLEGLVAKGDVTLLSGREGLGKSFFTMGLSVAVAEGHDKFLGATVKHHGNVLYLDQENPEDDIKRRIKGLGLENAASNGTVRYLWNQGIRLDKNPDDFLDEAIDFQPEIIVVDSLTRVHTQDENSAGQMAALFNDGIQPLARATGAAVILIHHDNKGNEPRGSVDITASVDNVLHVRGLGEENPSKFVLKQGKTRRRKGGDEMVVEIVDLPEGKMELRSHASITPPF